jgi:serine/threonine protein kinase
MPKKRNQNLYKFTLSKKQNNKLVGGKFIGQGAFGCIYDMEDVQNVFNTGADFELLKKFGKGKKFTNANNSNSDSNNNNNNAVAQIPPEDRIAFMRKNEQKVVKVFFDQQSFNDEVREIDNIIRIFKRNNTNAMNYSEIFPEFYEYGILQFERSIGSLVGLKFKQCDAFKQNKATIDRDRYIYFVSMKKLKCSLRDLFKSLYDVFNNIRFNQASYSTNEIVDATLTSQKLPTLFEFEQNMSNLVANMHKMHDNSILHSDIKPENILVDFDNKLYFGDMGGLITLDEYHRKGPKTYTKGLHFRTLSSESLKDMEEARRSEKESDEEIYMALKDNKEIKRILDVNTLEDIIGMYRTMMNDIQNEKRKDLYKYIDMFALGVVIANVLPIYKGIYNIVQRNNSQANTRNMYLQSVINLQDMARSLFLEIFDSFPEHKESFQKSKSVQQNTLMY